MKKDIKCEILEKAKQLFNQYGYNHVSMRQIADSLNISVGNLTYHFKKKEDLMETIVLSQHQGYIKFPAPQNLEELNQLFIRVISYQTNNAFYFRDYTQIGQLSPKVKAIQTTVTLELQESLTFAFNHLKVAHLLIDDELPSQSESLMEVLMLISIGDLTTSVLDRLKTIWLLIYPLLSDEGKLIFKQKIQHTKVDEPN